MADLDAKIRALEEQVARESAEVERARQNRAAAGVAVQTMTQTAAQQPGAPAVQPAGGEKVPPRFAPDADARSIFIGNLPKGFDNFEELAAFFADCGPVLKCTLLRDKGTGVVKGTAYIEFGNHEAAGRAVDAKNNAAFRGQPLVVKKKISHFNPALARGGRGAMGGRGRGGVDPTVAAANAMATMMGAMMGMMMGGRGGGRGGAPPGGMPRGAGFGGVPPSGGRGFRPF